MTSSTAPMTPDFEVKLLLNPSTVLDPTTSKPLPAFLSLFNPDSSTKPTPIQMTVAFLDTDETQKIYQAGWSPRIRRMKDEPKKIELTYKKRYPVPLDVPLPDVGSPLTTYNADPNTPVSVLSTAIDSVLAQASSDGFDASESGDYDAQIEWGYAKLTLSISKKKKEKAADWNIPVPGSGSQGPIELPDEETCRRMLVKTAPKTFDNWGGVKGWGTDELSRSRIYGPVFAERYEGVWNGLEVDIEIWPIKAAEGTGAEWENTVEISFKTEEIAQAKEKQGELLALLKEAGYWKEGDSLKTGYIMERY
ncbi:hypothetical protein QBC37DRAFT_425541 [Rhypophila decipiens]|uniref:CYTH domain-containing protein n=1 Tax=Rhypophila decipiens TaxID=261697 RepID=A0AAN6Y6F4_9PEZI|nr:hypothetical protein QBC37DRAFT_425541 [Rhypophila decipiens]